MELQLITPESLIAEGVEPERAPTLVNRPACMTYYRVVSFGIGRLCSRVLLRRYVGVSSRSRLQ
jgi:hypothetical protein